MATDKEIADNIIACLHLLNKLCADAAKRGLEVSIGGYEDGVDTNYKAKIFRRQDTIIAESPKRKGK